MVVFIQIRTLEIYTKNTLFKTCQFKENGLSIFRLRSEHNYSEKGARKDARFMDDASTISSIKYSNVENLLLFSPSIKISGYALAIQ